MTVGGTATGVVLVCVGEEGQQATLAKSLLASSLLSQGTPIISQDALADPSLAAFVSSLVQFRHNHSALLQPHHFSSSRELLWHGATIGSCAAVLCCPAVHALTWSCMCCVQLLLHTEGIWSLTPGLVQPGVMLDCLSLPHMNHLSITLGHHFS